jgi:hypothetical protein
MTRSSCFRSCALLLVLSLLASPAFAAPRGPGAERSDVLATLWQALGQLLTPFSKLGPEMDPAGTPRPQAPSDNGETTDLGPTMDPAGAPHP